MHCFLFGIQTLGMGQGMGGQHCSNADLLVSL